MADTNLEFERIKIHLQTLFYVIGERDKIIPLVSSLAATVLVVATFNEKLIPVNNTSKALISILFAVIPISLFDYAAKLRDAEKHVSKQFPQINDIIKKRGLINNLWAHSIYFYILIIAGVITGILILLWRNQ